MRLRNLGVAPAPTRLRFIGHQQDAQPLVLSVAPTLCLCLHLAHPVNLALFLCQSHPISLIAGIFPLLVSNVYGECAVNSLCPARPCLLHY